MISALGSVFYFRPETVARGKQRGLDGLDPFCQAAGVVNDAANPAGLALDAGVAAEPLPEDVEGRAMQLVTVLRELRGSAHLVAVLASGLAPNVAHYLRRPDDYGTFGWLEGPPELTDEDRAKLAAADALTDALVRPAYTAVDEAGGEALVAGMNAIEGALAA